MPDFFQRVLHPEWYHGHGRQPPFFEGWYYKLVNAAEDARYAIIPGVFIHADPGRTHAFIQVLNGSTGEAFYHTSGSFEAAPDAFTVRVDASHFEAQHLRLAVDDAVGTLRGELFFEAPQPWPVTAASPGIMGWYGWLPALMECNHGVLSLDHTIRGSLEIYGQTIDFTGGRGYIEKDWGQSFPTGYVWMQCNHFDAPGISLTASIATIPGVGPVRRPFVGYIVGFLYDGLLYRFTTYNGAKVDRLVIDDTTVTWTLYNRDHELKIVATRASGGLLLGPRRTDMHLRVDETMQAVLEIELNAINGSRKRRLYHGHGRNMAMEVVGETGKLLKP